MQHADVVRLLNTELKSREWTVARLGEEVGMSEEGVSRILSGEDANFNRILQVCVGLGFDLQYLRNYHGKPGPVSADSEAG